MPGESVRIVMMSSTPALLELEQRVAALGENQTKERVDALTQLAYALRTSEQWERMQTIALEAASLAQSIGDGPGEGAALGILAFAQYIRSDLKSALANCMRGLQIIEGDPESGAKIRLVLGMVHWTLGNFDEALRHIDRSLPILRESEDGITTAHALSGKGGILHSLGQYDLAVAFHRDALELFREEGYRVGVARALSGLGSAYQALGLLAAALECHKDSLDIAEKAGHALELSRALTDLGQVYDAHRNYDEALACHHRALGIREQEKYLQPQTTNLFHLGSIYRKLGNTGRALEYLKRGLGIAEELGARPKVCDFHHQLSELHEQLGDLGKALHHYKAYEKIKGDLFSDQATLRHKALELESELEIHRLRNVELAALLEELQQTQAELLNREKMATLGSLVGALAHEINSPLGVIQSASDLTLRCADRLPDTADSKPAPKSVLEALRTNARLIFDASQRITQLVASLKAFAHLDRAEFSQIDLTQSLEHTLALLEPEFRDRITVTREYQPLPTVNAYGAEINQVFMSLLRNAAEAIDGSGFIKVATHVGADALRISITDSGRGIPEEQRKAIFNPGFKKEGSRVRTSWSLFGCLNTARKHGGDIEVVSTPGKGSTFIVVLPRTLEHAPEPLRFVESRSV
jgi:signal transduction histidine kinase/Flp pilus assembly protein TadD